MKNLFSKKLWQQLVPNVGTIVVVALMLFGYSVYAAPPAQTTISTFPYQGTLTDASENPVTDNVDMTFRIFDVSTGGTALWTEAHTEENAVPVENGLFQLMLGSLVPIPESVWNNSSLFLEVQVGNDTPMSPRELIGSVPRAIQADITLSVPDKTISSPKLNLQNDFKKILSPVSVTTTQAFGIGVPIPGSEITITLDKPSRILFMAQGVAFYDYLGGENSIMLRANGGDVQMHISKGNAVDTFSITTFIDLEAGTHTLELYYSAQQAGATLTMQGWEARSSISYIVFNQN